MIKTTAILMLLGALLGIVVASYVVPPALSWYSEPAGLPNGAQIQALVQIPEVIRYSTSRLIYWQTVGAGIGAVLGLVLSIALRPKRPRAPGATVVVALSVVASSLCSPFLASARAQGIGGGVTVGVGDTEINATNEPMNVLLKHKFAPAAGFFVTIPVGTTNLWVQPEMLLTIKGTQWKVGDRTARIDQTYLDVPVLVRYAGPPDQRVKLNVFAGPYVGLLVRATFQSAVATASRLDVADRFRTIDLGWSAGVGLGGGPMHVDLRYGGSFTNVVVERGLDDLVGSPSTGGPITYRNRAFALLAGYRF